MKREGNIIVGISIGDLNGIGSEVVLKTFEDSRMLELCTPVLFANVKQLSFIKKNLELGAPLQGIDQMDQLVPGKINVLNVWREGFDINFGNLDEKVGKYAIKSLEAATKALQNDQIDVLVTAPIHKYNIQSETFTFPGHTSYLEKELGGTALMFMIHDNLRIGLLTDHIPVQEIAAHLTPTLLRDRILLMHKSLVQDFAIDRPRIAVLGLNPHAGDQGVIGKEDLEIIQPVVNELFQEGKMVFGPYPADGFFGNRQYEQFDAVLAMYHDQGLIPFKTLSFGSGVNFTAGLSKIRTSPDHGTAFDIAGKGLADNGSFREAVYAAIDLYRTRAEYNEISSKPLKIKAKQL